MKKEYIVTKTSNGFIVRFGHLDNSYREENLRVALTLEEVTKIIKDDLKVVEEK